MSAAAPKPWVLVGGSGFVGTAVAAHLVATGRTVTVVDRHPPRRAVRDAVRWVPMDLLESDRVELPPGRVAVLLGASEPAPAWSWRVPLDHAMGTARLAGALAGRDVVVASSIEVYGPAEAPLCESTPLALPVEAEVLEHWVARVAVLAAAGPCPAWRAAPLCRELADHDPGGRWLDALAKRAQELLVVGAGPARLRVVRLGNVVGAGQEREVTALVRAAQAGRPLTLSHPTTRSLVALDDAVAALVDHDEPGIWNVAGHTVFFDDLTAMVNARVGRDGRVERAPAEVDLGGDVVDSAAFVDAGGHITPLDAMVDRLVADLANATEPVFEPPLPIVTPPRPARPDVVADRQAGALWHGELKAGQRWSSELSDVLARALGVDGEGWSVIPTVSGTAALRLAVASVAGPALTGQVALLPSYTFPATAEAVVQLGYRPQFVDVDRRTWTLDPGAVAAALEHGPVGVVVGVDTFGNPLDYRELARVCAEAGVPFVADSAAALGSTIDGGRVGSQADAHAFSMSFAKTVIAGGSGGALVLPRRLVDRLEDAAGWSRSELMAELHAVTALDQLSVLDELLDRRRALVARYRERLAESPFVMQLPTPGAEPVLAHLVVRVTGRERGALARSLDDLGIQSKPYFPALHRTTHRDPAWAPEPLPVTDLLHREALALPLSSEMATRDVDRVLVGLDRAMAVMPLGG